MARFVYYTILSHYFWKRWFEWQFYRWFYNAKLLWLVFLILRGTWHQSSAKVEVPHCSRESSTSMSRSSLCRYPGRCSENKKTTETTLSPSINNLLYSLAQKPTPPPNRIYPKTVWHTGSRRNTERRHTARQLAGEGMSVSHSSWSHTVSPLGLAAGGLHSDKSVSTLLWHLSSRPTK